MNPGSIVKCRNREWVLLPSDQSDLFMLRPLTGATDEVVSIHKGLASLARYSLSDESITSATFPLPTISDLSDAAGSHLLWQAARLTLREGATPFRSLGRISVRPRTYQFVPLMMALRLDPVRILIADDVGVGKTIEGLLIAREMLDRGEIKRLCVLCPPYLCEQWQKELTEKMNLEAVIVRSGTIGQLERAKTSSESIYRYYPIIVASIDFVKSERNKHLFLQDCPEFVIVDEAHGSAVTDQMNSNQHQRHELVKTVALKPDRHLIMLTATPHSGIESAFRSLLELLNPDFGHWDVASLKEPQRIELARHFVQRTRRDIEKDWEGQHCFPKRESTDETYLLSADYKKLFQRTYDFCREMVSSGVSLDGRKQRVRYWGALALLSCVMSSPAAAIAALETRHDGLLTTDEEPDFRSCVFDSAEERNDDSTPTPLMESAQATLGDSDKRRLRELGRHAAKLLNSKDDTKLTRCAQLVKQLLKNGHSPIIWCRYIATADYVASALQNALAREFEGLRVVSVTGNLSDDERSAKIEELASEKYRVLVSTDCLSEGMNLQQPFNAALHYDLPWNPNRLEQREGRVDRYGQTHPTVKTIRYFSPDNPVDGAVIEVLLNKAREIHRTLGTHVPVPEESESVTQAVLNALFFKADTPTAPTLFDGLDLPVVNKLHQRWDAEAKRERENRSRFAQRALKPEEVRREIEATDNVLGSADDVRDFVLNAAQRLNLPVTQDRKKDVYRVPVGPEVRAALPDAISFALPDTKKPHWYISFVSPTPEGAEYLGRNHRFVAALAQFLMEEALTRPGAAHAARCGVIRTRAVSRLTTLLLLRVRYLLQQPDRPALLAEEVQVLGMENSSGATRSHWLTNDEALRLLSEAQAVANVLMPEKRELIAASLAVWDALQSDLNKQIETRAAELQESHRRIRQSVSLKVRNLTVQPQHPPDLLGLLVLQPVAAS